MRPQSFWCCACSQTLTTLLSPRPLFLPQPRLASHFESSPFSVMNFFSFKTNQGFVRQYFLKNDVRDDLNFDLTQRKKLKRCKKRRTYKKQKNSLESQTISRKKAPIYSPCKKITFFYLSTFCGGLLWGVSSSPCSCKRPLRKLVYPVVPAELSLRYILNVKLASFFSPAELIAWESGLSFLSHQFDYGKFLRTGGVREI